MLVRVADRRITAGEFEDIVIRGTPDGGELRVGDVASVRDGYAETDQASYYNGELAVRLVAYRVGDETPMEVADAAKELAALLDAELPDTITLTTWDDDSQLLRGRIQLLVKNAAMGLVLVFIILALFLDPRLAFWVGLGIPISFLGTFLLMPWLGVSINMISLFALIITLGMVVDDAIVVGENIYQHMQEGLPRMEAAVTGARQMAAPVTFAILTTMAAFSPLMFVPGFMGKIFGIIPIVVVTVLVFSLLESFLILPAHLGHGGAPRGRLRILYVALQLLSGPHRWMSGRLEWFIKSVYRPLLGWVLELRSWRIGSASRESWVRPRASSAARSPSTRGARPPTRI